MSDRAAGAESRSVAMFPRSRRELKHYSRMTLDGIDSSQPAKNSETVAPPKPTQSGAPSHGIRNDFVRSGH